MTARTSSTSRSCSTPNEVRNGVTSGSATRRSSTPASFTGACLGGPLDQVPVGVAKEPGDGGAVGQPPAERPADRRPPGAALPGPERLHVGRHRHRDRGRAGLVGHRLQAGPDGHGHLGPVAARAGAGWRGRPAQAAATAGSSSLQVKSSRSLAIPALMASVMGP